MDILGALAFAMFLAAHATALVAVRDLYSERPFE